MNEIAESNIPTNNGTNVTLPAPPATLTPGWQTTEFWMTILNQGAMLFAAASGAMSPKYAALFGVIGQVAYNLSRGIAKLRTTN